MATSRFSMDQKLHIIQLCEDGTNSIKSIASLFELSVTTLNGWRTKYRVGGFSTLHNRTKWTRYPEELRMKGTKDGSYTCSSDPRGIAL
ncbi:helix-turn-helix domain-containing protein [Exiguobacterium sp. s161]|uniref:helix-turn-helix domain-containing protein n=1 Tax=Exiguobacterium sp. s161 TaxID=2751191 RepID=UPI0021132807|nr:helix-turn-helix domain-containing protein [Exiguobacterium sp. s161]